VRQKRDAIRNGLEWAETTKVVVTTEPLVRDSVKNRIKAKVGGIRDFLPTGSDIASDARILDMIDTEIMYEGYVKQHHTQIERLRQNEERRIPLSFDFHTLKALSAESREVLTKVRPTSLGQASRLPGVKPPDIAVLSRALETA
jgi:tRNA uridine 5-carboxymethylaminomethyl modification enzyme